MTRRWILPAAAGAALLAVLAALAACSHRSPDAAGPPARAVHVAPVANQPIAERVRAVGLLAPKDEARLAFKTGGVIEAIHVEEGAHVRAGELLALVKQAEVGAVLDQARQGAAKAERDLARARALFADGVATEEQVQDLTTAARVAAASLQAAEFNASYARILAPADGVVLRKLAQPNELVQAGQPVLVVGGATRGWIVRLGLADRDAVRVHTGDRAEVRFDAFPDERFRGQVTLVASSADPANGTFTIEVQVEPGTVRFAEGLVARVTLSPADAAVGRVVPLTALVEANGSEASVFVLEPGASTVRRRAIRIGRLLEDQVEVREGLEVGQPVVVDGAAFLENGEAVRVLPEAAASAATRG